MKIIRPTAITDNAGSFTRSTTATYFNSSGVLSTAAINVPRVNFAYNPDTTNWDTAGMLLEPARTNLCIRSQEIDNASWTKTGILAFGSGSTANAIAAPDGTTTADLVTEDTSTGVHEASIAATLTVSTAYAISIFVKAGTRNKFRIAGRISGTWSVFPQGIFDLSTSSVISSSGDRTAEITNVGGGWYRCTVYGTTTSIGTSGGILFNIIDSSNNTSYTGNGTGGLYVWGAQLEAGTFVTSYIPTTTASVLREADTCTGTGFIYSNLAETDYAAWVSGTTYALGDRVIRTTATTHAIYERVVAGAGTTAPEIDSTNWIRVGPTNRWSAFDDSPSTLSSNSEYVTYILKPGKINSVALLEVDAREVAINFYTDDGGLIEQQYYAYKNLSDNSGIGNWYEYFYEPFYYQTSFATTDMLNASLLDLPQYSNTILCVTVRKAGSTASVGVIATGIVYELGKTQNGMSLSIVDYSKKDTDDYGNTILVRRKFSKRVSATFFLYSSKVDVVSNLLTQYRATPVVWIGADAQYSSLVVYGFYRDWNIGIPNNIGSTCTIEIEGLT